MVLGRGDMLGKNKLRIKMKEYPCLDDFNFAYITCCLIKKLAGNAKGRGNILLSFSFGLLINVHVCRIQRSDCIW
jgi:hypothetical protein